jgi:hypothetical protein
MTWPTVRSAGGSGERLERLLDAPVAAVGAVHVRDGAKLERGHARRRSGPKDAESFHRLDVGERLGATHARARADRQHCGRGQERPRPREERGIGRRPLDAWQCPGRVDEIAVEGFRPEHERAGCERPCAGEPDVEDARRRPLSERPRGRVRGLHRADAAAERDDAAQRQELELRGGDDEHRVDGRREHLVTPLCQLCDSPVQTLAAARPVCNQ